MKILGFDLGDGESCVTVLDRDSAVEPRALPLDGRISFLSAVGVADGKIVIGEAASVQQGATEAKVRFKSRYLVDVSAAADVRAFAQGVVRELTNTYPDLMAEVTHTVVGCPAGWGDGRRQQYAALMESAGFVNVSVVPEPRAAFLYARHARGLRVDPALMRKSAMVIDMGSSTTDFAYIVDGHQQDVSLFGDTNLGGGLLDALILARAVNASPDREALTRVFSESSAWKSYCELEARRLKEKYFLEEGKGGAPLTRRLLVCYDDTLVMTLSVSPEEIREMITEPLPALGGVSFIKCLKDALERAALVSRSCPPGVLILTGGASRMAFLQEAVRAAFPEALLVLTPEPECSVARGLAYAGRVDENLSVFRREVASIARGEQLERAVRGSVHALYEPIAEALYRVSVDSTLQVVDLWRHGGVDTIEEMDGIIGQRIAETFQGDEIRESLSDSVGDWLQNLMRTLENELSALCVRCGVPPEHMALKRVALDTGVTSVDLSLTDALGMDVFSGLMGVVFAAIGAAVCGGGGIAMIGAGPVGLITGAAIGIVFALLGRSGMEKALQKMKVPVLMRRIVSRSAVERGLERQKENIKAQLIVSLSDPANGFADRLTVSLGRTLGEQLENMAKNAEMSISA
ncbi:MAG: Hsp70 family protein [Clostridiales bacterium]|nr:Hsp70 family protein [Clostridiales bacterium]